MIVVLGEPKFVVVDKMDTAWLLSGETNEDLLLGDVIFGSREAAINYVKRQLVDTYRYDDYTSWLTINRYDPQRYPLSIYNEALLDEMTSYIGYVDQFIDQQKGSNRVYDAFGDITVKYTLTELPYHDSFEAPTVENLEVKFYDENED